MTHWKLYSVATKWKKFSTWCDNTLQTIKKITKRTTMKLNAIIETTTTTATIVMKVLIFINTITMVTSQKRFWSNVGMFSNSDHSSYFPSSSLMCFFAIINIIIIIITIIITIIFIIILIIIIIHAGIFFIVLSPTHPWSSSLSYFSFFPRAGISLSGCLIACDISLDEFESRGEVDLANNVAALRRQRANLLNTMVSWLL